MKLHGFPFLDAIFTYWPESSRSNKKRQNKKLRANIGCVAFTTRQTAQSSAIENGIRRCRCSLFPLVGAIGLEPTSPFVNKNACHVIVTPHRLPSLLTQLVGQVYESASPAVRGLLLEKLLRPMGVLALVSVAGGIFAKIRLRGGLQAAPLGLDDVKSVSTSDVLALAERVQLASAIAIHAVSDVIANSPMLARHRPPAQGDCRRPNRAQTPFLKRSGKRAAAHANSPYLNSFPAAIAMKTSK